MRSFLILALVSVITMIVPQAYGVDVSVSLESNGSNSITVLPGESFTVDFMISSPQNLVSAQAAIDGDSGFYAAAQTINANNGWDTDTNAGAVDFTPGPLPTADMGTVALDVFGGALPGKLLSLDIQVDGGITPGTHTLSLSNVDIGDLNYDPANIVASTDLTVEVLSPVAPTINLALSLRSHGGIEYGIDVSSSSAVECRAGGPQKIVVVFDQDIAPAAPVAGTDVTVSSGTISSIDVFDSQMTIELSGVANASNLTVEFPGIVDASTGFASVTDTLCFGVMAGDIRSLLNPNVQDGVTNVFDMLTIKANINQPANAGNFKADLRSLGGDVPDGIINVFDALTIKANLNASIAGAACP